DPGLRFRSGFLDSPLWDPRFNGLRHAASVLNFGNMDRSFGGKRGSQMLDIIRTAPWVDNAGGAALLLQKELSVTRDPGREIAWQRERLVERVGVQRLDMPLRCRHRLNFRANDIVENVLSGEGPAGCLRMGAKDQ